MAKPFIVAVTGHRPDNLGGPGPALDAKLRRLAIWYFSTRRPDYIISGFALGWDLAVAEAALELKIPLIAAIPFPDQAKKWPEHEQRRWGTLKQLAEIAHEVCPYFTSQALQKRNEWMVENASKLVALWDGTPSGTGNCVRYALGKIPIDNIWPVWQEGAF